MDLTVWCSKLQISFETEIVVGAKAVDQAVVVFLEAVGVTNPFVSVLVPANLVFVKAHKVWVPVLLVPSGRVNSGTEWVRKTDVRALVGDAFPFHP